MKKNLSKLMFGIALLGCIASLGGCIDPEIQDPNIGTGNIIDIVTTEDNRLSKQDLSTVRGTLDAAIQTIQDKDYQHFAELIDSEEGIQFFQYAYNANSDGFRLTKSSFTENDPATKYVRGTYDGSGFPIEMTIDEYFSEFVNGPWFEGDFGTEFTSNEIRDLLGLERLPNLYPDGIFVQYNYGGSEEFEGFDREKVYIVLDQTNGERKIVAIIHDQWTI